MSLTNYDGIWVEHVLFRSLAVWSLLGQCCLPVHLLRVRLHVLSNLLCSDLLSIYTENFGKLFNLTRMKIGYVLHIIFLFGIRLKNKWGATKLIYYKSHIRYCRFFFNQPKGKEAHRILSRRAHMRKTWMLA